jgi:hypothetical protein
MYLWLYFGLPVEWVLLLVVTEAKKLKLYNITGKRAFATHEMQSVLKTEFKTVIFKFGNPFRQF